VGREAGLGRDVEVEGEIGEVWGSAEKNKNDWID